MSGIFPALSGYNAAMTRPGVSTGNIANQSSTQTIGPNGGAVNAPYVPQQVVQSSAAGGGVTTSTVPVSPASVAQYDPNNPAANAAGILQAPNVDLAQQLVAGTIASYDAQANLRTIATQDRMTRSILNIVS